MRNVGLFLLLLLLSFSSLCPSLSLSLLLAVSFLFWIFGKIMQEEKKRKDKAIAFYLDRLSSELPRDFSMVTLDIMSLFIRHLTKDKCCKINEKNTWLTQIRLQIICRLQLMEYSNNQQQQHQQQIIRNNTKNQPIMIGHGKLLRRRNEFE